MRFQVEAEPRLFGESVRAALGGWEPPARPELGTWWDDRDDRLAARLDVLGWRELWADPDLLPACVAGAIELGRAVAPLCLLDEATLGAPLCLEGRARHVVGTESIAVATREGLALVSWRGGVAEPTLDATGTVRDVELGPAALVVDGDERWRAWVAATIGYLAGIAHAALGASVAHARGREQFGAPIGALAAVQARLADAATLADGLELCAWAAAGAGREGEALSRWDELAWAGTAAREVTAASLQVHGAIGFALEGGIHRFYRRAKVVQVWGDSCRRVLEAHASASFSAHRG